MSDQTNHPSAVAAGLPPHANPRVPSLALPAGSCDAHCHIFGPFERFPLPADRSFTPHEAPETALRKLHDRLGLQRAVIVQSQGHGHDHRPLLDALAAGGGRYRGVALVGPSNSAEQLAAFDKAGVCGARFNFLAHLGGRPSLDTISAVIDKVRPFDWHVAIHIMGQDLIEYAPFIRSIGARVVIDHMARPSVDETVGGAVMSELRRLIDTGNVWVKLSGADRLSRTGQPFSDALPIARSLARHAPERVLWGTDWPHVNLHGPMPDDGDLVDLIAEIVPSQDGRRRLLVDNPTEFFRFK